MVEIIGGSIWFLVNFLGVSDIYMLEICIVAFYSVNPCSYHFSPNSNITAIDRLPYLLKTTEWI